MFKNILISGLLCTLLSAESFDTFLQRAIKSSPYLESSALIVQEEKEKSSIIRRYENPSLELEYSDFNPDIGSRGSGYRVNIAQPIRLWGVGDDRDSLAIKSMKNADANYLKNRARFIRDISVSYVNYAKQKSLEKLNFQELDIAKKIFDISLARYEVGTISRGVMLQAKIEYEMVQIKSEKLSLALQSAYYHLLTLAGINEKIVLDTKHFFTLKIENGLDSNPQLIALKSQQDKLLAKATLKSNRVEWIDLFAEFESEPNQNISRVGVNFPLTLFNTKSEEVQIAKLQSKRTTLLIKNQTTKLSLKFSQLSKERSSLALLQKKSEKILLSEEELLKMFQDGYRIANINLLQLQDIKNRLISTKRDLIEIQAALDTNAILQNYNQGYYND